MDSEKRYDSAAPDIRKDIAVTEGKNADGRAEFFFAHETETAGGLVFEDTAEKKKEEAEKKKEKEEKPSARAEFEIPDMPTFDPKYNTAFPKEESPRIYQTYVPTFTEASDNYRMTGRTTKEEPKEETPNLPKPHVRKVERVDPVFVNVSLSGEHNEKTKEETPADVPEDTVVVEVNTTPVSPEEEKDPPLSEKAYLDEREELDRLLRKSKQTERTSPAAERNTEASESARRAEPVREIPMPEPTVEEPAETVYETESADVFTPWTSAATDETERVGARPSAGKKKRKKETEYQMFADATKIKNGFLDSLVAVRVRLWCAVLLTLVLAFVSVAGRFGFSVLGLLHLEDYPWVISLIDLQLSVCVFLLSLPEFIAFCKDLFAGRVSMAVFSVATFPVLIGYDIYTALAHNGVKPLLGTLYAVSAVAMILSGLLRTKGMFTAFKLISVRGVKNAVERKMTRELPEENVALDGTVDEYKSECARISKASFISGFFRRHKTHPEESASHALFLLLSFGVSLIAGIATCFVGNGLADGIFTFVLMFLASAPVAGILAHAMPYCMAERACFAEDSAVIGESSLYEYAGVDVITFDDTELFGRDDVSLKRVLIYGDKSRFSGALRQMSSLFSAVGGPLGTVFADTLDRLPLAATHLTIERDGVSGLSEGTRVHAGTEAYMRRHALALPNDTEKTESVPTNRILYLAENGKIYAKFIVRYAFSEEFTTLLPYLRSAGVIPLIYTRDPGVQNDLLLALTMGEDCMRVLHKTTPASEDETVAPRAEAGMVTLGGKSSAVDGILLSKRYVRLQNLSEKMFFGQLLLGLVLSLLASIFLKSSFPFCLFGLMQLVFCGAFAVFVGYSLSRNRIAKEKNEDTSDD